MENLLLVVGSIHYTDAGIMSHKGQQLSTGWERDILNPSTWKYSHVKNIYKLLMEKRFPLSSSTVNFQSHVSPLVFHQIKNCVFSKVEVQECSWQLLNLTWKWIYPKFFLFHNLPPPLDTSNMQLAKGILAPQQVDVGLLSISFM